MDDEIQKNTSGAKENLNIPSDGQSRDEVEVWKDRYLRLLADLDNTKKRLARTSAQEVETQQESMLKDLLPIADGLDLALRHTSREEDSRNILQGIELNRNLLEKFFSKYNVEEMEALGQPFDPNQHESLGMIRYPSVAPNTVVRVEQKGYLRSSKLLRPAQVIIASH